MTMGKIIALTRLTCVSKLTSLLFNMLPRLLIFFIPVSKHLLISWLQSQFAVFLEPQKIKSVTVSIVSAPIGHEVMGLGAMILVFSILSWGQLFTCLFKFLQGTPQFLFAFYLLHGVVSISEVFDISLCILIPACASSSPPFSMMKCEKWKWKLLSHVWLQPHRRYHLWNSLGQYTGVGSISLLQGIFPMKGSCMMYTAYKLNKQSDNTQSWHNAFPNWKKSVIPCLVLSLISWPADWFLRRWVRWSCIPISLRILQSLLWSTGSKALA